ncbi:hypothetical protein ASL14_08375 [Paenibacillus sp. IHB B 3084]|uniref:DUF2326 domain-containing protein n=1 Tax=Paenibacillus TaxID=44249 RepID=UPI0007229062|nr:MULTISPECIES: DUF2326 domain-containing protein [Paenibacillus]ALP36180.1 hypothetical protein ASL14_08375 [Paenibacillus sp. IHB B 3084]
MFLKLLKISTADQIIREIKFHKGLNLIVDETPTQDYQSTGNNVGKTTVLKLIDFCLGAKPSIIYADTESKRDTYKAVKDFLIDKEVLVTLILTWDLDDKDSKEIKIERNFLSRNRIIRRINGENLKEDDFEPTLLELIFPNYHFGKPTFRQIISHNIRYKDLSINNTLKTLDRFTSDAEYETLYLFLLGCVFAEGEVKQEILTKLKQEETYRIRLEKNQTKTAYEAALLLIEDEILELNKRKTNLNINENFEKDLDKLNNIKYQINRASSTISNLNLRRDLIIETEEELDSNISNIDLQQLKLIYEQATNLIGGIQKSFEELVSYHNNMIAEKKRFIASELPHLEEKINEESDKLKKFLSQEKEMAEILSKSDSFDELEKLLAELNERYRKKGEYESVISQINEVESNIVDYNDQLKGIDDVLFSDEFEQIVKNQTFKFNKFFAAISNELYGERYALKYDKITNKNKQTLYKFSSFNANLSSGKKQGEILCFDLAYILFADSENIPCLHFLLNDKKELMHDNQLLNVARYIGDKNIQLVASILKDKLPKEIKNEKYYVVKLSQEEKLFRIEEN